MKGWVGVCVGVVMGCSGASYAPIGEPTVSSANDQTPGAQGDDGGTGSSGGGADAAAPGPDAARPDATLPPQGSPQINLTVAPLAITEGQSATFRAAVTDPSGAAITGGTLTDNYALTYGAFAPDPSSPGSYNLTLSWPQVDALRTIQFEANGAGRTFIAVFTDANGGSGKANVSLGFKCPLNAACGGACVDLSSNQSNCGHCGNTCDGAAQCKQGVCVAPRWSTCFAGVPVSNYTCAQACQDDSKTCSNSCDGSAGFQSFGSFADCQLSASVESTGACADSLPGGPFRCCCSP
jgi:hypothetical protein